MTARVDPENPHVQADEPGPSRPQGLLALALLAGLALSCGGGGSSPTASDTAAGTGSTSCTTPGQCTFVRDTLQSFYYWYKELPNPDPGSFASAEAYLEAVRYRTLDSSFSYITSKASSDAFYSDSQFIGFGLCYKRTADTELRLAQTFPGSPAADAGMDRGDTLVSVNGKAVADLLRTGEINTIFGAEQVGVAADLAWRDMQGRDPAPPSEAPGHHPHRVADRRPERRWFAGGLHPLPQLRPALGGGPQYRLHPASRPGGDGARPRSPVQRRRARLGRAAPGGPDRGATLVGQVFVQFTHNDKQSSRNTPYKFEAKPQALGAARLVVIATRGSASASEAIINGLRPYMDVKVVGDTTYGKPVGQYGFDFCEKVLYPVAFLVRTRAGRRTTSTASRRTAPPRTTSTTRSRARRKPRWRRPSTS